MTRFNLFVLEQKDLIKKSLSIWVGKDEVREEMGWEVKAKESFVEMYNINFIWNDYNNEKGILNERLSVIIYATYFNF